MMFSVLFAFVCLITPCLTQCPDASFLKPCSCKKTYYGLIVLCSRITDAQTIRSVMNVLAHYTIATFTWHQVNIHNPLSADFFRGVTVEEINIVDSKFSFSPNDLPFFGLEPSLRALLATRNAKFNFPGMNLTHMKLLEVIQVLKVQLPVVRKEWIENFPDDLRVLKLEDCEIIKLEDNLFQSLSKLQVLSLALNEISDIMKDMMPKGNELEKINFSGNRLYFLPDDLLKDMPKLKYLDLSANRLFQVREEMFLDWRKRNRLDLDITGTRMNKKDCKAISALKALKEDGQRKYNIQIVGECNAEET